MPAAGSAAVREEGTCLPAPPPAARRGSAATEGPGEAPAAPPRGAGSAGGRPQHGGRPAGDPRPPRRRSVAPCNPTQRGSPPARRRYSLLLLLPAEAPGQAGASGGDPSGKPRAPGRGRTGASAGPAARGEWCGCRRAGGQGRRARHPRGQQRSGRDRERSRGPAGRAIPGGAAPPGGRGGRRRRASPRHPRCPGASPNNGKLIVNVSYPTPEAAERVKIRGRAPLRAGCPVFQPAACPSSVQSRGTRVPKAAAGCARVLCEQSLR
ncbi:translation initiation factor IF-2 [Cinclus cinclus]|uniref:translation initiation factor IF-2 n=1 Tax=Cinclus cinclus TaxID=127875 RepID=UPI002E0FD5AE